MKKTIKLSRIHCAGCAENLEQKVAEVDGVNSVSIDFLNRIVTLDVNAIKSKDIIKSVEECITKFDSSIKIIKDEELEKEEKKEKLEKILSLLRIAICLAFGISGYFIPDGLFALKLSFYILSYLAVGYTVIIESFKHIKKGKVFDENFLMFIATVGAFVLQQYIEAIAVMLFYSVGEFFEELAVEKSKRRIKSISEIRADNANLLIDGEERIVDVNVLKIGDKIIIKPGERVPVDCEVISGNSYINTSAITGESKEQFVKEKSSLLSGCINISGVITAKVTSTMQDSTASKILDLVEKSSKNKAKTEKFITRFAKWYTPIVVGVALLLFLIPGIITGSYYTWLYRALVFLVVSCPCALVLSVPLGYFAGIGASARNGILIKGANYLELLARVDSVVFDKTGTLTCGNFKIKDIYATENSSKEEVLELIAYAEFYSNHRIAKSIVSEYKKQINNAWIEDYTEVPGKGVVAKLFMEECIVGNAEFLHEYNIIFNECREIGTVIYIAKNKEFLGYIVVDDKIKEDSFKIRDSLKAYGVKNTYMFTGDNEEVAGDISKRLNLDGYYAKMLPNEKVEKLSLIKSNGNGTIVFVGDGINDAPVLATVDVGISMGGVGSDAAIEASDVVIMTDEPSKVVESIKVAKKTRKIVLENIIFTLGIKVAVLVLSALGITGMWLAIFADIGVALLAVLNSMRAMIKPKR